MSKETVPTYIIYKCDKCGKKDKRGEGYFANGGVHAEKLERWQRSGVDGAAGCITTQFDLCQYCAFEFQKWMDGNL